MANWDAAVSIMMRAALPTHTMPFVVAMVLATLPREILASSTAPADRASGRPAPRVDESTGTKDERQADEVAPTDATSTDLVPMAPNALLVGSTRLSFSEEAMLARHHAAPAPIIGVLRDTASLVSTPGAVERAVGAAGPLLRAPSKQLPLLPLSRFEEDFTPIRVVGRGMFSKVYVARHNKTGILRAVKAVDVRRLRATASSQKSRRKSGSKTKGVPVALAREVALLARLRHPHIVRLFSAYAGSGAPTSPVAARNNQDEGSVEAPHRSFAAVVGGTCPGRGSADSRPSAVAGFGSAPNSRLLADGPGAIVPIITGSEVCGEQKAPTRAMVTGCRHGLYELCGRESSSGSDFAQDGDAPPLCDGLSLKSPFAAPLVKHSTAFDPDALGDEEAAAGSSAGLAQLPRPGPSLPGDATRPNSPRSLGQSHAEEEGAALLAGGAAGVALVVPRLRGLRAEPPDAMVLASPTMLLPAGAAIGSADAHAQTSMSRRLRRAMAPPSDTSEPAKGDAGAESGGSGGTGQCGDGAERDRADSSGMPGRRCGGRPHGSKRTSSSASAPPSGSHAHKMATLRIPTETGDDVLKVGADTVLLVTELAEGGELFDRLVEAGNFAEHVVRHVMWQLLSALAHLHARGLVHRDVKPENILVLDPPPTLAMEEAEDGDKDDEEDEEDEDGIDADDASSRPAQAGKPDSRSPRWPAPAVRPSKRRQHADTSDDMSCLLRRRGQSNGSQASSGADSFGDDPAAPPPSLSPLRLGPQGQLLPTIKLADFGIARHVGRGPLAMAKTFCGSPQYVAPEVIRARDAAAAATRRRHRRHDASPTGTGSDSPPSSPEQLPGYGCEVDVWSAGVVMYALLAGELPFDGHDYDAVAGSSEESWVQRILHGSFRFDPPVWTHVSAFARDLITRMLQVNPFKRPSAVECLRHPWFLPMHAAYAARLNGADDLEAAAAAATAAMAAAMPTARALAQSAGIGPAAAASVPPSALVGHPNPFGLATAGPPLKPFFSLPAASAGRIGMAGVEQDVLRAALAWASGWLGEPDAALEAGDQLGPPLPAARTSLRAPQPRVQSASSQQARQLQQQTQAFDVVQGGASMPTSTHRLRIQIEDERMHPDAGRTAPRASSGVAAMPSSSTAGAGGLAIAPGHFVRAQRASGRPLPGTAGEELLQPATLGPSSRFSQRERQAQESSGHSSTARGASSEGKLAGTVGIEDLDVIAPLRQLARAAASSRSQVRSWRQSSLQAHSAFASVLQAVAGAADGVVQRCMSSASRCAALTASISTAMLDSQLALGDGDSASAHLLLQEARRWVETVVEEANLAADAADTLNSRVGEAAEQSTSASVGATLLDGRFRQHELPSSSTGAPAMGVTAAGTPHPVPASVMPHCSDTGNDSVSEAAGAAAGFASEASGSRSAASVAELEELTSSMKRWILSGPERGGQLGDADGVRVPLDVAHPSPHEAATLVTAAMSTAGKHAPSADRDGLPPRVSQQHKVFRPLSPAQPVAAPASASGRSGNGSSVNEQSSPQIAPLLARAMHLDAFDALDSPAPARTLSVDAPVHVPAGVAAAHCAEAALVSFPGPLAGRGGTVLSGVQGQPERRVSVDGRDTVTNSRAALQGRRSQSVVGSPASLVMHSASAGHVPQTGGALSSTRGVPLHPATATDSDSNLPLHVGQPSTEGPGLHGPGLGSASLTGAGTDSSAAVFSEGLDLLHSALTGVVNALRAVADKWRAAARLCEGALPAVDRLSVLSRASSTKLVLRAVDQLAKASLFWRSAQAILEAGQDVQPDSRATLDGAADDSEEVSVPGVTWDRPQGDMASIRAPLDGNRDRSRVSAIKEANGTLRTTRPRSPYVPQAPAADLSEHLGLD